MGEIAQEPGGQVVGTSGVTAIISRIDGPPEMRIVREDGSELRAGMTIAPGGDRIAIRDASITGPLAPEPSPPSDTRNANAEVYCGGHCDEMGCRGHDVLTFRGCTELADDKADLLEALFEEVERCRDRIAEIEAQVADRRAADIEAGEREP